MILPGPLIVDDGTASATFAFEKSPPRFAVVLDTKSVPEPLTIAVLALLNVPLVTDNVLPAPIDNVPVARFESVGDVPANEMSPVVRLIVPLFVYTALVLLSVSYYPQVTVPWLCNIAVRHRSSP